MRPAPQRQPPAPLIHTTGVAQPVRLLNGGRAMMWNGALYLRDPGGHWAAAPAGNYQARRHFTLRAGPGGDLRSPMLRRVTVPVMAQQAVFHHGGGQTISVRGVGSPSNLRFRPAGLTFSPANFQAPPPANTALQVYSKPAPVITHGEFPSTGVWGAGGTFGGYSMSAAFQWTTDPSRVRRAVLQVSTKAFPSGPATTANWDLPFDGLRGMLEVPGPVGASNSFTADIGKYADFTAPTHPKLFVARVVPLTATGELAGQPSAPVYLVTPYVPPPVLPHGQAPTGPRHVQPTVAIDSWRPALNPANSDDFAGPPAQPSDIVTTVPTPALVVAGAFPSYVQESVDSGSLKGSLGIVPPHTHIHLDWSPPDLGTSGWDAFADFVVQLGDYIESAVNWTAAAFNTIKNAAVSVVADVMEGVGVPSSIADAVANVVVDAVMSSCGIPPSLPDMDQLENMGIGYITDVAADQLGASGVVDLAQSVVSNDQIRQGVSKTIQAVKNSNGGSGSNAWFLPDPSILYHPPVLILRATYTAGASDPARTDPEDVTIQVLGELPDASREYDEQNGAQNNYPLWIGHVHIPPMRAGESNLIPVVLDFAFNGPAIGGHAIDKDTWSDTYPLAVTGRFSVNGNVTAQALNSPW